MRNSTNDKLTGCFPADFDGEEPFLLLLILLISLLMLVKSMYVISLVSKILEMVVGLIMVGLNIRKNLKKLFVL